MMQVIKKVARNNLLFNLTCSQFKAFRSLDNFKMSTFSSEAKQTLINLEGIRIFDSSSKFKYTDKPPTCTKISDKDMLKLVKPMSNGDKYLGNWVILIHKTKSKYITVCGLFDCTDKSKYEHLVKHMNLCVYAKVKQYKNYVYLCSGTFVYSPPQTLIVTALSGTWKDAKTILHSLDYIPKNVDIDHEIIKFAEPRINKLLAKVFSP